MSILLAAVDEAAVAEPVMLGITLLAAVVVPIDMSMAVINSSIFGDKTTEADYREHDFI